MSISKSNRLNVRERAKRQCEYCKRPEKYVSMEFEIDHILPKSQAGTDNIDNLCYACPKCNRYKSNRLICIDPDTHEEVPLFNPRTENWSTHFAWSENYTEVLALTAIGRATINCLQLNHDLLLESRSIWFKSGWIPD